MFFQKNLSSRLKLMPFNQKTMTSTLFYAHLVQFKGTEFNIGVAKTLKEDEELLKAGFECVTE